MCITLKDHDIQIKLGSELIADAGNMLKKIFEFEGVSNMSLFDQRQCLVDLIYMLNEHRDDIERFMLEPQECSKQGE